MNSCKIDLFLSDLKIKLNFLDRITKNSQIPNFMKIRPAGVERVVAECEICVLIFLQILMETLFNLE